MIRPCKVVGNGFGIEDISEDGLSRTSWHFNAYSKNDSIYTIYLSSYTPNQTRKSTRHKWTWNYGEKGYRRNDNRHYNGGGLDRALVPMPEAVKEAAIEWAKSTVKMDERE